MRSPGIEPGSLPWQGNILTVGQRTHRYCHEIKMFRELKIFRSTLLQSICGEFYVGDLYNSTRKTKIMMNDALTVIEQEIYDVIANKYLKMHKELNFEVILPFILKSLKKYSQSDISTAISSLMDKQYLIKGSSLSRDDIVHNGVRKQILQFIRVNPGCYNRLIRRRLNIGSNEFNWHIGMLEKFGLIKKLEFERSWGYFENRSYMDHEFDLYLLQNEKASKIITFLQNQKANLSQIAKSLDMHYSTVQKYLEVLFQRKLIKIVENVSRTHINYEINAELLLKLRKIVNGAVFVEFAE